MDELSGIDDDFLERDFLIRFRQVELRWGEQSAVIKMLGRLFYALGREDDENGGPTKSLDEHIPRE